MSLYENIYDRSMEYNNQILNKNTSPYFHSVSLVIWPLSLMKRIHFSELSISRFSTYIRKAKGWTLHFRTPDPRSEKIPTQNDRAATNTTQNPSTYTSVSFQFNTNSIFPAHRTLSHSFLVWRNCRSTTGAKLRCSPRRGSVYKGGRVTKLIFNGRVSRLTCAWAVRNLWTGNFWSKLRLGVGSKGRIEFVVNLNEPSWVNAKINIYSLISNRPTRTYDK